MGVSFLVALRVAEYVSAPLRKAADAGNLMADANDRLSTSAKAANTVLLGLSTVADTIGISLSASAAALEENMARLSTATETTTTSIDTALNNAERSARDFSVKYSASVNQIIEAQFRLATAGIPVAEQVEAVQAAFKFARATNGEFLQSAELLGSFLNTFGKTIELNYLTPGEKVAKITDVMSAAVQKYQIDMENLNDSLKFLVGPASTLGLSISETAAFAGALNTAGFRGTLAGTAISNAFNKIDNAIEKLDLDPSQFTDASGNLKDFASFLDEVEKKTASMTSIEKQSKFIEVFDIRAGRAIGTLLQMKEGVKQFAAEMDIAQDVTKNMADTMEQTTQSRFKQFLNSIVNISTTIGGELNQSIKVVLSSFTAQAAAVGNFVDEHKTAISAIAGLSAVVLTGGAALVTYSIISGTVARAFTQLAASGALAGRVITGIQNVASFASLAAGIGGVALAGSLLYASITKISEAFDSNIKGSDRLYAALAGIVGIVASAGVAYISLNAIVQTITASTRAHAAAVIAYNAAIAAGNANAVAPVASLLARFGPIAAGIAAAIGGVYLLTKGIAAFADAMSGSSGKTRDMTITMEAASKLFGSNTERVARYSAELERLSKITEKNISVQLKKDQQFGKLPFAVAASQDSKSNPTKSAKDAIDDAVKSAGGYEGILRQVAETTGSNIQATIAYGNAFIKLRSSTDSTFDGLKDVTKGMEFFKATIAGAEIAMQSLGDGSAQSVEALKNIASAFDFVNKANISGADRANQLQKAFEAIDTSITSFRKSSNEAVRGLVEDFDAAKASAKDLKGTSSEFFTLINGSSSSIGKVVGALQSAVLPATTIGEAVRATTTSSNQLKTSMTAVNNLFKNAKLGGEGFAYAVESSTDKIANAEKQLQNFKNGIEQSKKLLAREDFAKQFGDTNAFKDLQKIVEDSLEIEVDLRARIDEGKTTVALNSFYALLDKTNDKHLLDARKTLGDSFATVINQSLTGKLAQSDVFSSLANAFKTQFIDKIQANIALSIGDKFKNEFSQAIVAAESVINSAQLGGTLFEDFASGDLARKINDAATSAIPGLKKLGIDNLFGFDDSDKLTKKFEDIFTDASVKMVTATNSTASALQQLQSIINEGAGRGADLAEQATRLQQLLVQANNSGAADAIRPIEEALSATLSQLRQGVPNGPAQQLTTATQQVEGTMNAVVGRFATTLGGLVPAAQGFISIIEEGFRRIRENSIPALAQSITTGQGSQNNLNVKIENGARTFNVTVDGNSNVNGLSDPDIKKVVDDAWGVLRLDMEETIRKLEDRLRGR